jgi:hypothetical protein
MATRKRPPTAARNVAYVPGSTGDEMADDAGAEAWIRANTKPGQVFWVATSRFAFDGKITGFWKGTELMTRRGVLHRLSIRGLIEIENVFWRGIRCRRL